MLQYEDLNTNIYTDSTDLLYIAHIYIYIYIYIHTHILAVSTITNTFIQQCTVLKEEEAEIGITIKGVTVIYTCSVYENILIIRVLSQLL